MKLRFEKITSWAREDLLFLAVTRTSVIGTNIVHIIEAVLNGKYPFVGIICPQLEAPDHGTVTFTSDDIAMGTYAMFSCDLGYDLQGSQMVRCNGPGPQGIWSPPAPTCTGKISYITMTS